MKIVAVIPAYNEEGTIKRIIGQAKNFCDAVIVVDDGSTDRTPSLIQRLNIKDVNYTLFERNIGVGNATKMGLKIARGLNADAVVTLDGDGQHDPSEIPSVLKPIKENKADIVIGSRFMPRIEDCLNESPYACSTYYFERQEYSASLEKISVYRKFGIDVITWLYNIGYKQRITDAQCCFRAYSRKAIGAIGIEENGFGFSTETLIKARKLGLRIVEVPVSCIYHKDGKQNSTLNPVRHGLEVAWKTILWRIRLLN